MYAEVETFPLRLCKRKCDRKGGGWWWLTARAGCLQMSFFFTQDPVALTSQKRHLAFLVATHFHPSSFQNNNAGKPNVILFPFYPFSSLESWYIPPPPPPPSTRLLRLLPDSMVMRAVTSLLNTQATAVPLVKLQPRVLIPPTIPPPSLVWQRCTVLEGSPFIGLLCFSSFIMLKWFCDPHFFRFPLREAWQRKSWVREGWWVCACLAVGGEATFEPPGREDRTRTIRGDACFPPPPPPPPPSPSPLWNRSCCVDYFSSARLE